MPSPPHLADLSDLVRHAMDQHRIPGVSIGILHEDHEWTAAFGVTNVEHPLPVDDHTLFQIGSITKTFLGTAVMILAEQGRLDLDAPVRTFLPTFRLADESTAARLTLRHLLTHTAGWAGDHFEDTGPGDHALATIVSRLDRLDQVTPLGEIYSYSNSGFYVVGRVLEVAAGKPLELALRDLVIQPLGLDMVFFRHWAHEFVTHRFAVGHHAPTGDETAPTVARPYSLSRSGASTGGIVTHVLTLLRYARFHMGDGRTPTAPEARLLSLASLRLMQEPLVPSRSGGARGLSWGVYDQGGLRFVTHNGATNGQQALLLFCPAARWALAVLTNSNRGSLLYGPLSRLAVERYLGLEPPDPSSRPPIPDETLREWPGHYAAPGAPGAALAVRIFLTDDGTPMIDVTPPSGPATTVPQPVRHPSRLTVLDPTSFRIVEGPDQGTEAELLRDHSGHFRYLRYAGRILTRLAGALGPVT